MPASASGSTSPGRSAGQGPRVMVSTPVRARASSSVTNGITGWSSRRVTSRA